MDEPHEMNKLVSIFGRVSLDVARQIIRCNMEAGETRVKRDFYPSHEYSVIIGVTGKYEGAVTMSIKEETAFFLASAMMGNKPVKELDKMSESALCELANITVSQSLMQAVGDDPFEITPPTFVKGNNVSFAVANVSRTYVTTHNTPGGVIEFNISLGRGQGSNESLDA